MNKYTIDYTDKAVEHIKIFEKAGNKAALKKIGKLIDELKEHPKTGTGHPEQLKGYEGKRWSRRIDKEHRICYEIHDDVIVVLVLTAYGHYDDN